MLESHMIQADELPVRAWNHLTEPLLETGQIIPICFPQIDSFFFALRARDSPLSYVHCCRSRFDQGLVEFGWVSTLLSEDRSSRTSKGGPTSNRKENRSSGELNREKRSDENNCLKRKKHSLKIGY